MEDLAARSWRRLVPERVHLADAVRGTEAWVVPSEYAVAEPNPLASSAASLLTKINGLHKPSLNRFAGVHAGVDGVDVDAELLSVDQLGFDLRTKLGETAPTAVSRFGFRLPPGNEEGGISVFMKLFQEAFERQNGDM